jgi:tRNA wybutosine-synthesizing protein 2
VKEEKIQLEESKQFRNAKSITETVHIENHIKFCFDVCKIMFSLGNNAERIQFSKIDAKGETIVDMFAGIGYFTLPLAKHSHCSKIIAIEKNPNSLYYLQKNCKLNQVEDIVEPILGDCRTVGEQYIGHGDRISMGYLPTPLNFLSRAFSFLKNQGGIIHYHYLATKSEYQTLPIDHFKDALELFFNSKKEKTKWSFLIKEIREIKSYAPKIFHWNADIYLFEK